MKTSLVFAIALSFLAAGCAIPEASTAYPDSRGEVRTGSNIPRKSHAEGVDRVHVINAEDMERSRVGAAVPPPR
jgi:hypothetical protein